MTNLYLSTPTMVGIPQPREKDITAPITTPTLAGYLQLMAVLTTEDGQVVEAEVVDTILEVEEEVLAVVGDAIAVGAGVTEADAKEDEIS